MRTMYDAVTARNILNHDRTPALVAGYVDKIALEPWSAADWALFPSAVKVRIVKKASTNDGHVLDVEPGDATPAEAPGWVRMRRNAGTDPTIYVNWSTWPQVISEFQRQGVAQPHYWIARYDNAQNLPTLNGITAIAKQYRGDFQGVDLNCVADYWPGVDPAPGGGSTLSHSEEDEEEEMYPKLEPVDMNVHNDTLPWDGREAVLNVIGTGTPVYVAKPGCWSPRGGVGGGEATVAGVNPARVEVNQPGQYRVPAGTTRIFYSYSCASPHYVWIKAV